MTGTWEGREFTRANKTKKIALQRLRLALGCKSKPQGLKPRLRETWLARLKPCPSPMFTHPTFHFRRQASGRSSYQ